MKYRRMKNSRRRVKNIIFMLAFVAALAGMVTKVPVLAAEKADEIKGSISLICPAEGMEISLYRVADYEDSFTLTGKFQNYQVSLDQKDQDGWKGAARALEDYIGRDGLKADIVKKSGNDKIAYFENLSRGLYLATGQTLEVQEKGKTMVYAPNVSLIVLPDIREEDPYHISPKLKYDDKEKSEDSQTKLRALKIWKKDQKEKRPTSVTVELLRKDANGKVTVADSQILSKENGWAYTWENLSSQARWSVSEKDVPSGYTVSIRQQGSTVMVTNTAKNPEQTENGGNNTEGNNSGKPGQKLPQTGQLWWPLPLLLLAGVSCLMIGRVLRNSGDEKKKRNAR